LLRLSHLFPILSEAVAERPESKGCSVAARAAEGNTLNSKLTILVRVDLDDARARVIAKGHLTIHSINALYVVVKRANSLKPGLDMELDVSQARVDQEALQMLQTASESHHLPQKIDPHQAPCTISVLAPRRVASLATKRLAA
jgi:hypothetical protein